MGRGVDERLAPVLAVAFMAKVEAPVLHRMSTLYFRFIDDCFDVSPTQHGIDTCFKLLYQQSEHISFISENPTNLWLAFLNVHIELFESV